MAKASEKYEVMYIISPKLSEEETAAVVEKFKGLVEANGTLEELEEMGKRKLAYEIDYLTEGYYVLMKFTSGPEFPAELDRILCRVKEIPDAQSHHHHGSPDPGPRAAQHAVRRQRNVFHGRGRPGLRRA